jgi:transposase
MENLPHFISYDRFLNYWIAFTGSLFYEGTKTMAVYHRHARGASETISVAEIWGQDLRMFEFLKPYFPDSNMYKKTRATAIARYVYQLARENKKPKLSRFRMALEYVACTVLQSRKDIYTFLLIIFGRPFFRLHQRTKGIAVESH